MKLATKKLMPGINKYLTKYPNASVPDVMKQFSISRKEAQSVLDSKQA